MDVISVFTCSRLALHFSLAHKRQFFYKLRPWICVSYSLLTNYVRGLLSVQAISLSRMTVASIAAWAPCV